MYFCGFNLLKFYLYILCSFMNFSSHSFSTCAAIGLAFDWINFLFDILVCAVKKSEGNHILA